MLEVFNGQKLTKPVSENFTCLGERPKIPCEFYSAVYDPLKMICLKKILFFGYDPKCAQANGLQDFLSLISWKNMICRDMF